MSYIDDQRSRMNSYGSNFTDRFKNMTQQSVNNSFDMASDVYIIQMEDSTGTYNDITVRVTTALTKTMSARTVIIHDDFRKIIFQNLDQVIPLGTRFQFAGYYWITIDTSNVMSITQSCIVRRCNNMLKFYDASHTYHEIPCIATNTMGNLLADQYMLLPQGKILAIVKYEDVAKLISLDPITRFILNGQAYKTEALDHISQVKNGVGWSEIMLQQTQIGEYDDVENGIADKYKPENVHDYAITITNGSSLSLSPNSTLQLNTSVTDNGNTVTSPTLTYTSSDPTVASVTSEGLITALQTGSVTISVALSEDATVNDVVSVNVVSSVSDSYSLSISGNSVIDYGFTGTFTANVMNNGVLVTDDSQPVTWSLFADDKVSPTNLATISAQTGSSITLQSNNKNQYGYCQLKATLNSDNSIVSWYRVQIESLI